MSANIPTTLPTEIIDPAKAPRYGILPVRPISCCGTRRKRPSSRTAKRGYQFPPSDGDWHVPLSV
jgi:hypothetical protein